MGYPWPPAYQWRKDGVDLPGRTNALLLLGDVSADQAGQYTVTIANALGQAHSEPALLTVLPGMPLGEALDAPHLVWGTWGPTGWFWQTNTTRIGAAAAQSGPIGDDETSALETAVTGPGAIGFWWKVSSRSTYDDLLFYLGGTRKLSITGEAGWEFQSVNVPDGPQTLSWRYNKRSSGKTGSDCGWVDGVIFATNTPPVIMTQPGSRTFLEGETIQLSVFAFGVPPLSYQWLKDGSAVADQTHATLALAPANSTLAGRYAVQVSNAYGNSTSAEAEVRVLPKPGLAEALDAPELVWTTGGDAAWFVQGTNALDHVAAAQSGDINDNQSTWLETQAPGPGTVSFWWRTDCQNGYDTLKFMVDGQQKALTSGPSRPDEWGQVTYEIASGQHTLRWIYSKNASFSEGQDCGWLDQVRYVPAPPPVIVQQPVSWTNVPSASHVLFQVAAQSIGGATYQWYKDGVAIANATKTNLVLFNVTSTNAGQYTVAVSNAIGGVLSSPAWLSVLDPVDPNTTGLESAGRIGGSPGAVWAHGNRVYWEHGGTLSVYDASNPAGLTELGTVRVGATLLALSGLSNYVYALSALSELLVVDVTDASLPSISGRCRLTTEMWNSGLAVLETNVYVASGPVTIVNVANPAAPRVVRSLPVQAEDVVVSGKRLWVAGMDFRGYSLNNPASPTLLGTMPFTGSCLAVQGALALLGSADGLYILDISSPAAVIPLATYTADGLIGQVALSQPLAYLVAEGSPPAPPRIRVFDLANPAQPVAGGVLALSTGELIESFSVAGSRAYLSQAYGLREVELGATATSAPAVVNAVPNPAMVNQAVVHGALLYVLTGFGPWVYGITNPATPVLLDAPTNWPGLKRLCLDGNRLYAIESATNGHALIFDAGQPVPVRELGRIPSSRILLDLAAQTNRLYLLASSGTDSWLEAVDVTNPGQTVKLGELPLPGRGRVLRLAEGRAFAGWTPGTGGGVSVVDLANPAALRELGRVPTVAMPSGLAVAGTNLWVGSVTANLSWHLELFDLTDLGAITRRHYQNGPGSIWALALQGPALFGAIVGQSVLFNLESYLSNGDPWVKTTSSMYHSPDAVDLILATLQPAIVSDPLEQVSEGYVFTADGNGYPETLDRSGYKGLGIQKYRFPIQRPSGQTGSLITRVEPPQAAAEGCTAEPARQDNVPFGGKVDVRATESGQWNFKEWTGAASGSAAQTEAIVTEPVSEAVAHFVKPVLSLSGGTGRQQFYPRHPAMTGEVDVITFTLSANAAADWTVTSVRFQSSGAQGNEADDIFMVKLYHGQTLISWGTYLTDNAPLQLAVDRTIPAGASVTLRLCYVFLSDPLSVGPYPKEYQVRTSVADIVARPIAPAYPKYEKQPPGPIVGGPIRILRVWNEDTQECFETIQQAIDAPRTLDGHRIFIGDDEYLENVQVHKSLYMTSASGMSYAERIIVRAANPNMPVFTFLKDGSELHSLTVRGAKGANQAGIVIQDVGKNITARGAGVTIGSCGIIDNYRGIVLTNSTRCDIGREVESNFVSNNLEDGILLMNSPSNIINSYCASNGANGLRISGALSRRNAVYGWYGFSGLNGLLIEDAPENQSLFL